VGLHLDLVPNFEKSPLETDSVDTQSACPGVRVMSKAKDLVHGVAIRNPPAIVGDVESTLRILDSDVRRNLTSFVFPGAEREDLLLNVDLITFEERIYRIVNQIKYAVLKRNVSRKHLKEEVLSWIRFCGGQSPLVREDIVGRSPSIQPIRVKL
jgi:hypothetical protein